MAHGYYETFPVRDDAQSEHEFNLWVMRMEQRWRDEEINDGVEYESVLLNEDAEDAAYFAELRVERKPVCGCCLCTGKVPERRAA